MTHPVPPAALALATTTRRAAVTRLGLASLALLGAGRPLPAQAETARYQIDPMHLSIGFLVDHVGFAKVLGMFRTGRGSYTFDEATATLSDVRIEIDTASVFSNQSARDDHLKSAEFLNSEKFPKMIFTAAGAQGSADRHFEIAGQLELLGQTKPLTLQATWNKSGDGPFGLLRKPYVMGVSARGTVKRSLYGMDYALANGWVGDDIALLIEFEAVRQ